MKNALHWPNRAGGLGPALGLAVLGGPGPSTRRLLLGWEEGAENKHVDMGTPGSTFKGCICEKDEVFYDFLLKLRLCKGHHSCSAGMFTYHKDSHCHWFSSFKCDNYSEFRLVGAVSFYVQ